MPDYYESETPLFSAVINNSILQPAQYKKYRLQSSDDVKLIVEAKGAVAIAYAIIAIVAV